MYCFILFALLQTQTATTLHQQTSLRRASSYFPSKDIATVSVHRNQPFEIKLDCTLQGRLLPIDLETGIYVDWFKIDKDGRAVTAFGVAHNAATKTICFGNAFDVCKCIRLKVEDEWRKLSRHKRGISDVAYSVDCGASNAITEGVLLLDTDYNELFQEQKIQLEATASSYMNVDRRNILIQENQGSFYRTGLENPRFVSFGLGDAADAGTKTTVVKFLVSCNSLASTDPRIAQLKTDSQNGQIRNTFGYQLISWYFIAGTFIPLTTTPASRSVFY